MPVLRRLLLSCCLVLAGAALLALSAPAHGQQSAPPCGELGVIVTQPIVDPARFCPEYLVEELPHSATAAITSLAYAPMCEQLDAPRDWCGALFFARPDVGAVWWVGDFDPDTLGYALHVFAEELDTPNGLAWDGDTLYVATETGITRLADRDGDGSVDERAILVDDLPHGAGQWTGSIDIGPDGRLYVSKGASCNACTEADPRRGAILSYAPDGDDMQIVASGLHTAFDFAWHPASGELWASESERPGLGESLPLDELNRVTAAGRDFGWPDCYTGPDGLIAADDARSGCTDTTAPALTVEAGSAPAGLTFYAGDAFPDLAGDLLVVTRGSWNRRIPSGYALYRVCFDDAGELTPCRAADGSPILDEAEQPAVRERLIPQDTFYGYGLDILQIQGQSFYPDHPVDIAVSPEGYLTLSVLEGRIIRVRPAPG
ncbi:MAG: PQQ-dependent sugar dehydrogenase [Anaerolineae bacterium]|nr:PQQ-dependent sugar dehydrogenase [Anaerolineae bacterium]